MLRLMLMAMSQHIFYQNLGYGELGEWEKQEKYVVIRKVVGL